MNQLSYASGESCDIGGAFTAAFKEEMDANAFKEGVSEVDHARAADRLSMSKPVAETEAEKAARELKETIKAEAKIKRDISAEGNSSRLSADGAFNRGDIASGSTDYAKSAKAFDKLAGDGQIKLFENGKKMIPDPHLPKFEKMGEGVYESIEAHVNSGNIEAAVRRVDVSARIEYAKVAGNEVESMAKNLPMIPSGGKGMSKKELQIALGNYTRALRYKNFQNTLHPSAQNNPSLASFRNNIATIEKALQDAK